MITSDELLLLLAGIILLGFIGEIAFRKKRIPDMLLLLLIGILIHYSNLIPLDYFSILKNLLAFFGVVALTLIVFGGVLKLDIVKYGHSVSKGIVIAAMDVTFVIVLLTPFLYYILKISLPISLLLSTILSETAAPFIIPLLSRINMDEELQHTVEIETIFNSVLNVIAALLILNIISGQSSFIGTTGYLFANISEGIVLGGVTGILWLIALKEASVPHYYMATVAVLFLLWGVSDYLNASAILSVFIFSIIIANSLPLSKIIKISGVVDSDKLTVFNQEISFFVLTFFYVYIGIFVNLLDLNAFIIAVMIVAILAAIRFLEIFSVGGITKWFGKETVFISSFIQRGPTVIVLLAVLLSVDPGLFNSYASAIFFVVILTILAGSLIFSAISRKYQLKETSAGN